eukprot:16103-Rhodomonas_salina.2
MAQEGGAPSLEQAEVLIKDLQIEEDAEKLAAKQLPEQAGGAANAKAEDDMMVDEDDDGDDDGEGDGDEDGEEGEQEGQEGKDGATGQKKKKKKNKKGKKKPSTKAPSETTEDAAKAEAAPAAEAVSTPAMNDAEKASETAAASKKEEEAADGESSGEASEDVTDEEDEGADGYKKGARASSSSSSTLSWSSAEDMISDSSWIDEIHLAQPQHSQHPLTHVTPESAAAAHPHGHLQYCGTLWFGYRCAHQGKCAGGVEYSGGGRGGWETAYLAEETRVCARARVWGRCAYGTRRACGNSVRKRCAGCALKRETRCARVCRGLPPGADRGGVQQQLRGHTQARLGALLHRL